MADTATPVRPEPATDLDTKYTLSPAASISPAPRRWPACR
jgi:hypothetical protein